MDIVGMLVGTILVIVLVTTVALLPVMVAAEVIYLWLIR